MKTETINRISKLEKAFRIDPGRETSKFLTEEEARTIIFTIQEIELLRIPESKFWSTPMPSRITAPIRGIYRKRGLCPDIGLHHLWEVGRRFREQTGRRLIAWFEFEEVSKQILEEMNIENARLQAADEARKAEREQRTLCQ